MHVQDGRQVRYLPRTELPRGLLGLPGRLPFRVERRPPAPEFVGVIDQLWTSTWDVPAGRAVQARVLPHPNVNLTVEGPPGADELIITGIAPGLFSRTLRGRGDVLGVKFAVGAFALISATPVQQLSPYGAPGAALLPAGSLLQQRIRGAGRPEQRMIIEAHLRDLELVRPAELIMVQQAAELLLGDPAVGRVGQAADRVGVGERTLQRLFARWVGVPPGWVLRRGRLHAAAERLIVSTAGHDPSAAGDISADRTAGSADGVLASIAADFGYADQAHFSNDFRRVLGEPPATWAANLVSDAPDPG